MQPSSSLSRYESKSDASTALTFIEPSKKQLGPTRVQMEVEFALLTDPLGAIKIVLGLIPSRAGSPTVPSWSCSQLLTLYYHLVKWGIFKYLTVDIITKQSEIHCEEKVSDKLSVSKLISAAEKGSTFISSGRLSQELSTLDLSDNVLEDTGNPGELSLHGHYARCTLNF